MKLSALLGERFKETPADVTIASHALLTRGGYTKFVGSGSFSLYLPARRITRKIEAIIREEMDAIDGQEVLFPVVLPAALWKESGRWDSVGAELVRLKDRNGADMVLGMTHEEAAVHLARGAAPSYADYPFMIYQFQTKFRDEPRPRAGLIRVREFTMKDGYSFHVSQEDLEAYYERAHVAYEKIFARCGMPNVISVRSDSGMMGGKVAHEFMMLADIGEDTLVICENCDFRSNMEVAACAVEACGCTEAPLTKVATPGMKTIEDVGNFLNKPSNCSVKAVVYQKNADDALVIVFTRGDLEINETKLRNAVGCEVHPAVGETGSGPVYGYIGPAGLDVKAEVYYDNSLLFCKDMVCGANDEGYHLTGFCALRDLPKNTVYADYSKAYGGMACPDCGEKAIVIKRGIEVGNIFQLGTKYTKSMSMTFLDANGEQQTPIMGCYGIGVGRLMASVCEARHDDYGPVWPMAIAPWQVHICALRAQDEAVSAAAAKLYNELLSMGVEVILDDRAVSAGFMFSDADLLGVPLRIIISPKTLARECVEVVT
ncbi:MAG: proline--tRNA ligase, partial [Clostridia bacterium]|nr:proline--tRNA ligase [Clostridia bacterium]